MPLLRHSHLPGHTLHVVQRGQSRATCFSCVDDRLAYLRALGQEALNACCALHAYALMGNHVHLLLTPARQDSVTGLMGALAEHHERYISETYEHDEPVWEKEFKTTPVHLRQYLLACMRYIESNPVNAGLVRKPQAYRWSSYKANALGEEDTLVTPHAHYCALGRSPEMRQAAYRAMFRDGSRC